METQTTMNRLEQLINLAAQATKFGQLDMTLGVHDGLVKYVDGSEHASKNFSTAGMQEAIDYALLALARERNLKSTGALTITFEFAQGNVKKVHLHRRFRHNLTEQKK